MTTSVSVYGFGSAFAESDAVDPIIGDVDLLIVHANTDPKSCQFAIFCKRLLTQTVSDAHITMLSIREEKHCQFIASAKALLLGPISEDYWERDIEELSALLQSLAMR